MMRRFRGLFIFLFIILTQINVSAFNTEDWSCLDNNISGWTGFMCGNDANNDGIKDCSELLACSRPSFGTCQRGDIIRYECIRADKSRIACETPACPECDAVIQTNPESGEQTIIKEAGTVTPIYRYICTANNGQFDNAGECQASCGSACECMEGGQYNQTSGTCQAIAIVQCPSGFIYDEATKMCVTNFTCPSGTVYDSTTKKCLGDTINICPAGSDYNATTGKCEATVSCPSGTTLNPTTNKCETTPSCPSGTTLNPTTNKCEATVSCPSGSYNPSTDKCETTPSCPSGTTLNPTTDKCEATVSCPSGTTLNPTTDKCEATVSCPSGSYNPSTDKCETTPSCPSGTTLNPTTNKCETTPSCLNGSYNPIRDRCEIALTPSCPSGTTYNPTTNKCETTPTCPSGGSYNPTTDRCEATGTNQCPTGTSWTGSVCATFPSCANGGIWNNSTKRCEVSRTPTCPSGGWYVAHRDRCEANPTCPSGGSYNPTTDRCEAVITQGYRCDISGWTYGDWASCNNVCWQQAYCNSTPTGINITGRAVKSAAIDLWGSGNRVYTHYWNNRPDLGDYSYLEFYINSGQVVISNRMWEAGRWDTQTFYSNYHNWICGSCTYPGVTDFLGQMTYYITGTNINISGSGWRPAYLDVRGSGNRWDVYFPEYIGSLYFTVNTTMQCPIGSYTCSGSPSTCTRYGNCTYNPTCPSGYTLSGSVCIASPSCSYGYFDGANDVCYYTPTYTCPSGYTYNASLNVCQSTTYTCPSGTTYNNTTGRCEAPATTGCPMNYYASGTQCIATPICVPTTALNATTDKCEATATINCPTGMLWDNTYMVCYLTPTCPSGTTLNPTTDRCEANPSCPSGGSYNPSTDKCEANPTCSGGTTYNPTTDKCEANTTCPSGTTYNPSTDKCEANTTCPSGTTYNPSTDKCEANPTCSGGTTYNPTTDKCEATPTCPTGTTYNPSTDKCETSLICPNDMDYNPTINKCETKYTYFCPNNTTYNQTLNRCVGTEICQNGLFNPNTNRCETSGTTDCPTGYNYYEPLKICEHTPICPPSDWMCPLDASNPICNNQGNVRNRRYQEINAQNNVYHTYATTTSRVDYNTAVNIAGSYGGSLASLNDREFIRQQYGNGALWVQEGIMFNDVVFNTNSSCYSYQSFNNKIWRPKNYTTEGCAKFPTQWEKIEDSCVCKKFKEEKYERVCTGSSYTENLISTNFINVDISTCVGNPPTCSKGLQQEGLNKCSGSENIYEQFIVCNNQQIEKFKTVRTCIESMQAQIITEYRDVPQQTFGVVKWDTIQCNPCLATGQFVVEDDPPNQPDPNNLDNKQCTNFKMMGGVDRRCRPTSISTIFSNCCDISGWFKSWCRSEEKELKKRRQAKTCVEVGTYCSKRVLGICLQRRKTFCCFSSQLAKILHEQGRPQIGKSWGSPKSPDCKGFTPEEFANLDFTQIDFEEFIQETVDRADRSGSRATQEINRGIQDWFMRSSNPSFGQSPDMRNK